MALLLAMYQKMRLIREKNQLVLDQTKISSKLTRVQKTIERTQKRYTSLFSQLESQSKMMESQAKVQIQNMFGLGQNCVNPYDYSGMNGFIINGMQQLLANGIPRGKDADGNQLDPFTMDNSRFQEMYQAYMQNGGTFPAEVENGQTVYEDEAKTKPKYQGGFTADEVKAFNMALSQARNIQEKQRMNANTMSNQYSTNVSIWLEAQKAALEAEQDAALEPLNYEDTMLQLEKEQKDARLQRINTEIETYTQLVSQEAKNSAPTFGLA